MIMCTGYKLITMCDFTGMFSMPDLCFWVGSGIAQFYQGRVQQESGLFGHCIQAFNDQAQKTIFLLVENNRI